MCQVSIPERVLGWLKLPSLLEKAIEEMPVVSIPERVLGWLKPVSGIDGYG